MKTIEEILELIKLNAYSGTPENIQAIVELVNEAQNQALPQADVSGSLTMRVEQMEFIPEEPFLSDVISWEKGNIWELHELFTDSQNIEVRVNKNYR
jgi:hypothetical protein